MSNFANNIQDKERQYQKDKARREKLATYFFDVSKLFIGGWVIGVVLPLLSSDDITLSTYLIILAGILTAITLALIANKILK